MVLELVKTIACHRAALQELAKLGDNKTSKRAQVLLEDIDACTVAEVDDLVRLHDGLERVWKSAWSQAESVGCCAGCGHDGVGVLPLFLGSCPGGVGITAGMCSDCHFQVGVAVAVPVDELLAELAGGANLVVLDGRAAITRDGQTQLGPPFTR